MCCTNRHVTLLLNFHFYVHNAMLPRLWACLRVCHTLILCQNSWTDAAHSSGTLGPQLMLQITGKFGVSKIRVLPSVTFPQTWTCFWTCCCGQLARRAGLLGWLGACRPGRACRSWRWLSSGCLGCVRGQWCSFRGGGAKGSEGETHIQVEGGVLLGANPRKSCNRCLNNYTAEFGLKQHLICGAKLA